MTSARVTSNVHAFGRAVAAVGWLLGLVVLASARAGDQAGGGAGPAASPGPLERVGQVDGHLWFEGRSSFDQNGNAFITRTGDAVRVWNASTLEPVTTLLGHGAKLYVISGDGKTVLTSSGSEVRLWDVATSTLRSVTRIEDDELRCAALSPDGSRFVTVGEDARKAVFVWRAGQPQPARKLSHREGIVRSVEIDPTGEFIVGHVSADRYLIWSTDSGRMLYSVDTEDDMLMNAVTGLPQFDPRGGQVVLQQRRGFVILDSATRRRSIAVKIENRLSITDEIRFSTDGSRISMVVEEFANGVDRFLVQVYDADTGKLLRTFGADAHIRFCQLINGGRWAVCDDFSNKPGMAELWDIETEAKLQAIPDQFQEASPDGSLLLFETPGRQTSVWRLREGEE